MTKRPWAPKGKFATTPQEIEYNRRLIYHAPEMAELLIELTENYTPDNLHTIIIKSRKLLKEVGYGK